MSYPSISFRFALFLSFSLTASLPVFSKRYTPSSSSTPKATPSDLLSLLGSKTQSLAVNPVVARHLKSCFKFLVPFSPTDPHHRKLGLGLGLGPSRSKDNDLIWWPPEPVLELARLSVDSGGDPAAIHRLLDPTIIPHRYLMLKDQQKNAVSSPELPMADASFVRFHAKEYPAYDKQVFPYNMGFCQRGSNVTYDDSMNLRNILWLAPMPGDSDESWVAPGVLVVLDARPDGIIYRDLIPDYVNFARTIYEDDFGDVAVDVNYLNVGSKTRNYQLFIC
ncbi:uncharacterized protein LOC109796950 isoform X2 [Cajanus cajan]|uniref:uncharacterized protein LOC109796950 isoform X2 n=1 Tax=Cajanus cajan TaxID=3821 RepID=UPI00098D8968|nr:uncharacterized protein LOC109796950 isoform X2 [Cajanus cajan]